jgi:hypothetical protein
MGNILFHIKHYAFKLNHFYHGSKEPRVIKNIRNKYTFLTIAGFLQYIHSCPGALSSAFCFLSPNLANVLDSDEIIL